MNLSALASTTLYVNGTTGSDSNNCQSATSACKTIGNAISLAASGDTIMVAAGTYPENITISKSLTILGAGPRQSIIAGGDPESASGSIVTITRNFPLNAVTLSGLWIRNGDAGGDGGGIVNMGQLFLSNSLISNNFAGTVGGGISSRPGATLTIDRSMIIENQAAEGGGISCETPLSHARITNSAIGFNRATAGNGGGILSSCQGSIVNSTIAENFSTSYGGGYYAITVGAGVDAQNLVTFLNVTIGQNTAGNGSNGSPNQGGGIFGYGNFEDTIIAGNLGGNCGTAVGSQGYNLSDDDSCTFTSTGDLNNTDPMLITLEDNGGPSWTMALPVGRPAIDAGNPNGCPAVLGQPTLLVNDQRGKKRPGDPKLKTGCDIGAYEYQFPK